MDFTASQVRALKEFLEDFFDKPASNTEAKALGKETGAGFKSMAERLRPMLSEASQYPFMNALTPVVEKLEALTGKPYTWYLTELPREQNPLLDMKEDVIAPILRFMSGPQRGIFDNACRFVQAQEPNFEYIESDEPANVMETLKDPKCFKGNHMQEIKGMIEFLEKKVKTKVDEEITKAKECVATLKERLCGMDEFKALTPEQETRVLEIFSRFCAAIEREGLIAVVRDRLRRFEESDYQRLLAQLCDQKKDAQPGQTDTVKDPKKVSGHVSTIKPIKSIPVPFDRPLLSNEDEVERYLESMRKALMAEIDKGKRIQV
jgi:hypothetical protein